MRSWTTDVYLKKCKEHPEGKFVAFFEDEDSAQVWLDKQEDQSIYEVRTK